VHILVVKVCNKSSHVPNQKMSRKDFDGLIDNMGTLVANQCERATELGYNEFINELNYDYNHVGF
jgi:hypothetical protein